MTGRLPKCRKAITSCTQKFTQMSSSSWRSSASSPSWTGKQLDRAVAWAALYVEIYFYLQHRHLSVQHYVALQLRRRPTSLHLLPICHPHHDLRWDDYSQPVGRLGRQQVPSGFEPVGRELNNAVSHGASRKR